MNWTVIQKYLAFLDLWKFLGNISLCRELFVCVRLTTDLRAYKSGIDLPSLTARLAPVSFPESVGLCADESDNCDCEGNNYR